MPADRHRLALGLVLALSLVVNVAGGGWGLPAEYSWSNDDPTPKHALAVPHYWSSSWYKYPYLQLWLDRALYQPTLWRIARAGQLDTPATDPDCAVMDLDCLEVDDRSAVAGSFMRRSRHLRALMGAGIALAAYALARRLRASKTAAVAAAAVVAVAQSMVFYAHVGNVDLPSAFWGAWALVAWAGLLGGDRRRDWLAFGALGGAALATKESVVGLFVLPALVVVWRRARREWRAGDGRSLDGPRLALPSSAPRGVPRGSARGLAALRGLIWPGPVMAAAGLFVVYGTALNVAGNPEGFRQHVAYWLAGPGIDPWNDRYQGPLWLLAEAGQRLVEAMGWPLAALCAVGALLALRRAPRTAPWPPHEARGDDAVAAIARWDDARWLVVPLVSYFLFTLLPVQYTYTRFVLPVVVVAAVWGGLAFEAAWRRGLVARALAAGALAHGLLVVVHLDALLRYDARYAAESWLAANAAEGSDVRYVGSRTHLPRLEVAGVHGERLEEADFTAEGLRRIGLPDVVLVSSRGVENLDASGLAFLAQAATDGGLYRLAFDEQTRTGLEPLLLGAHLESRINPRVMVLVRRGAP